MQHCVSWWQKFWGEARTRILLRYVGMMVLITAAAIPVFRIWLFARVDARVTEDLTENMEAFQLAYREWETQPNQTATDLKEFATDFLERTLPEDDNYMIFLINNQFYKSNPRSLPPLLAADSQLIQRWLNLTQPTVGKQKTSDADVGTIVYQTEPLFVDNQLIGTFIVSHLTAGERMEVLDGVYIFAIMAAGVVLISFVLAWIVTDQVIAPVRTLAVTARKISESDLDQRIEVNGDGEMADLANTFNAMMNRIQTAFTSQRNFVNDAGHELRTPITIIQGHLELMGEDPQEQAETKALIQDELQRMSRFVNDLILLARAEHSDFLYPEILDINELTEELYAKAKALGDRNWKLVNQGAGKMMGDRQRITGAVMNLAQNAVQHTQPGDSIEMGSKVGFKEVRFWVRDTGDGIPFVDHQRIFERFARARNSCRRSEGAGLGLTIVQAIAEAHGGKVELVSQPGAGSTFTLVLPLEQ